MKKKLTSTALLILALSMLAWVPAESGLVKDQQQGAFMPRELAGGPVRVMVTGADTDVRWILPGQRGLDPAVFGTPDSPLGFEDGVGVPLDQRLANEDGTAYTTTEGPTPFSDEFAMIEGSFELDATDITLVDNEASDDQATFTASFTGPDDKLRSVRLLELIPVGLDHPFFGGVATNVLMHGQTGIGTKMLPMVPTYVAFWGVAELTVDGEVVASDRLLQGMLTSRTRNEDYELVFNDGVDDGAIHFHLIMPDVAVTPDGPEQSPVPTGFELSNGDEQSFFHVVFEDVSVSAGREPMMTGDDQVSREPQVVEVVARNYEFEPSTITVTAGVPVTFVVESVDIFHTFTVKATEDSEEILIDLALREGEPVEYTYTFEEAGSYYLYCIPHEALGMVGEIVVAEATTTEGSAMEPVSMPEPTPPPVGMRVQLEEVASGFNSPVALVSAQDESGRLFVVDRIGLIYVLTSDGTLLEDPFLDVRDRMVDLRERFDERGLLGLAFHPDYAENGRFFVYYSAPLREEADEDWDHTAHVSEFAVADDDPDRADPDSERIILQVDEPQFNHDGGEVVFGPDGYLYISFGDGGAANDQALGHGLNGNGQNPDTLLGSILRIDVDTGNPYDIPSDNPFADGEDGAPEIFAYGLRNPWRMSFDAEGDHELFVADVGQNLYEEVNIVTNGGNYGWNIKEGTHCFDHHNPSVPLEECPDVGLMDEPLIDPIIEYGHPDLPGGIGTTVIGGFVYRGSTLAELEGTYVFADWSTSFGMPDGTLLFATPPSGGQGLWAISELAVDNTEDGRPHMFILGFGQDTENELYVLANDNVGPTGSTGTVWKIVPGM